MNIRPGGLMTDERVLSPGRLDTSHDLIPLNLRIRCHKLKPGIYFITIIKSPHITDVISDTETAQVWDGNPLMFILGRMYEVGKTTLSENGEGIASGGQAFPLVVEIREINVYQNHKKYTEQQKQVNFFLMGMVKKRYHEDGVGAEVPENLGQWDNQVSLIAFALSYFPHHSLR